MIVECPYCHRKYEPKPNEKYCPCCGEEIKQPLKDINKSEETKSQTTSPVISVSKKPIIGKVMFVVATCLVFLSFIFMFGPAFYSGSSSIFHLTFIAKDNSNKAYAGLIVAFVAYAIMYIINIFAAVNFAKGEESKASIFVGVISILLVASYLFYLTFKFKTDSGSSYYGYAYSSTYALGEGSIKFVISLAVSSILYFIAPAFNK